MMNIVVVNDDGWGTAGIRLLAKEMTHLGHFLFCKVGWVDAQERQRHVVPYENEIFVGTAHGAHGEYENTQLEKS